MSNKEKLGCVFFLIVAFVVSLIITVACGYWTGMLP